MCINLVSITSLLLFVSLNSLADCNPLCSNRYNFGYPKLRKYNVDPASTTVSGISNGGGYAAHISFIYSSIIHGAGIFAASPYPMMYLLSKHVPDAIMDIDSYYPFIDQWSRNGDIDSTDNLKGFKAYVFMGMRDMLILHRIVRNVIAQYEHYGADVKDVTEGIACGHCVPTRNLRNNDPTLGWFQGICNVGYEGVFDMFWHFYGDDFKEPESEIVQPTGDLFRVDVAEFYPMCNPEVHSMNGSAWMYVPKACSNEGKENTANSTRCRLHIAFHGFQLPWRASIVASNHNAYVEDAGYLQAADANNIILLFPESLWRGYDIIGFTGPEAFVKKDGAQNLAIKRMIERITHGI